MGKSKSIKNALIAIISTLQHQGEPAFTQVIGHTEGEFNSYPSVRVLPGDQSSEKATTGQNDRTVNLIVRTHVRLNNGDGFDYMYDLTDLLMDTMDSADFSDALNTQDPTIGTHFLAADRGDWFTEDSPAGPVLLCDLNVEVRYSRNN